MQHDHAWPKSDSAPASGTYPPVGDVAAQASDDRRLGLMSLSSVACPLDVVGAGPLPVDVPLLDQRPPVVHMQRLCDKASAVAALPAGVITTSRLPWGMMRTPALRNMARISPGMAASCWTT
ncbi:hypothetical protein [Candidatus Poriferisodalis sp.]|uniref:hypothetical protein n=1 Tax=Candidatus Poriferisodalis sp. TaxID=3101277 RepID=UPI003B52B6E3